MKYTTFVTRDPYTGREGGWMYCEVTHYYEVIPGSGTYHISRVQHGQTVEIICPNVIKVIVK